MELRASWRSHGDHLGFPGTVPRESHSPRGLVLSRPGHRNHRHTALPPVPVCQATAWEVSRAAEEPRQDLRPPAQRLQTTSSPLFSGVNP
ncbi:hypothetical protein E2C01_083060 [Portunus trituberculatus]|uniref:Uncharacterized protein n=1 Tax=Portunus trituberculatus TaxID=210409 RepID=A0A5B7J3H9_PORTR|nr:hypothetical protein [Portunus trituberculatus]